MNILSILTSPAPGGAEMLVSHLSTELRRRGHCCRILFMSRAAAVGNSPDFERAYLADLDAAGIGYEVMPAGSFRNPLRAALALRRAVRNLRPDLVHAHVARAILALGISGLRLPTIFTHHSVTANFPLLSFRLFDRVVDRYVAIGAASQAFLERHSRGRIALIYNGVAPHFAEAALARQDRRADGSPIVLSVGNLRPVKDYPTLIEAAAIVRRRRPGVRFHIVGEGVDRPRLQSIIADLDLAATVELLGARTDVATLMQDASLLANSSIHEGLSIALIEAAMSGLPIVATDVGGNGEIVVDGDNGYLVPPGRADLLADRIEALLADDGMRAAFGDRSRARAQRFSLERCADDHLALYEEVSAERSRRPRDA